MPKQPLHIPRSIFILLLVVIGLSLLVGSFRVIAPALAQAAASPTLQLIATETPTEFDLLDLPPTEMPTLPPDLVSADTTGIITMAIVLVGIIVLGTLWGLYVSTPHLRRKRNK
jgi:hypothetical protein